MSKNEIVINIGGVCGAGKTTLARELEACLRGLGFDVVNEDPDLVHVEPHIFTPEFQQLRLQALRDKKVAIRVVQFTRI